MSEKGSDDAASLDAGSSKDCNEIFYWMTPRQVERNRYQIWVMEMSGVKLVHGSESSVPRSTIIFDSSCLKIFLQLDKHAFRQGQVPSSVGKGESKLAVRKGYCGRMGMPKG